jgi:methionine-rich copper-binding protein CopC
MRRTTIALLASALLVLFVLPGAAQAAPTVLTSDPERDSEVHQAPAEVSITFNMPLDASASKLGVFDECGRRLDAGDLEVLGNKMTVSIEKTPSGLYEMRYIAAPPADATGTSSGVIPFTVHGGKPCGPAAGGHGNHGGHGSGGQNGNHQTPGSHGGHGSGGSSSSNQGQHSSHTSGTSPAHSSSHSNLSGSSTSGGEQHSGHASGGSADGQHSADNAANNQSDDTIDLAAVPPQVAGIQVENIPMSTGLWALLLCLLMGAAGGYLVRNGVRL